MRAPVILASAILAAATAVMPAAAQEWPSRNVTIVVPTAAGTGMDTVVRIFSEQLSKSLGRTVVVENKPGAALTLAAAHVAASAPDGYTLLITTATPMVVAPVMFKQMRYNPDTDLNPIALYAKSPFLLVINPKYGVRSVAELIALAKKSSPPLTFASTGPGSGQHLAMEFMKQKFSFDGTHVPYKSSPQSIGDIAAGHVAMGFVEAGVAAPLARDGKLNALAASSLERLPVFLDAAPLAEAAKSPGFEAVSWHVLAAPAKTPAAIIQRLNGEMRKIMDEPSMIKRIQTIGLLPVKVDTPVATRAYIDSEAKKWGSLVRRLGLEKSQ